jgi:hypothetical protein
MDNLALVRRRPVEIVALPSLGAPPSYYGVGAIAW